MDTSPWLSQYSDDTLGDVTRIILGEDRQRRLTESDMRDLEFIKKVCQAVSRRAAAFVAAALYALWLLHRSDGGAPSSTSVGDSESCRIACHGSVIMLYPNFRRNCQDFLNLLARSNVDGTERDKADVRQAALAPAIALVPAGDATILGAAIAAACSRH